MESNSAASRFARTALILQSLGEQVRSLETLHSLCLTSKLFYSEFSIHLYRSLDTRIDLIDEHNPHLVHTKHLLARGTWAEGDDEFNEIAQRLLQRMPRLEILEWPPSRGLDPATLEVLRDTCSLLQAIHVHYPNLEEDVTREMARRTTVGWGPDYNHDLSAFTNLQYLSLTNLNDDLLRWKPHIVQILRNSPTLKGLNISISALALYRYWYDDAQYEYEDFFDNLCDDYAAAGGQPLQLRSLRCGQAAVPTLQASLAKLTDLKYLEDVEIYNRSVYWQNTDLTLLYPDDDEFRVHFDEDSDDEDKGNIAFEAFEPSHCPKLRHFSAAEYRGDVHSLLGIFAKHKSFSKNLSVRFERMGTISDTARMLRPDPKHPGFPIQLRMLQGLQLDRRLPSLYLSQWERVSAEQVIGDLVSSNADTLEGLLVIMSEFKVWREVMTPSMYDFQELEIFAAALPRLSRLTQLAVNTHKVDSEGEGKV